MQYIVGVLKRFGILAAFQIAALSLPLLFIRDSKTTLAIVQLLGVLFITWVAYAAGYNSGSRVDPLKSTEE